METQSVIFHRPISPSIKTHKPHSISKLSTIEIDSPKRASIKTHFCSFQSRPLITNRILRCGNAVQKPEHQEVPDLEEEKDDNHKAKVRRKNLAVFVSGGGSNFRSIYEATLSGSVHGDIVVLITNKHDCGGAEYASSKGIPVIVFPKKDSQEVFSAEDLVATLRCACHSWTVPTTGFPPVTTVPHIRPLHVWGHPSADQSLAYMWPAGHVGSSHSPPAWAHAYHPHPQPPPGDPYFWYRHPQDVPAQGMPYFPPHIPPSRFTAPPVSGLPSTSMYRVAPNGQSLHQPSFDSYPSKESIDAVIGEVLSRPWLPLPLGLKPPSIDSVMLELQRQGISKVPPACV